MQFMKKVSLLLVFIFCFGIMTSCTKGSSNKKITMSTSDFYNTATKNVEMMDVSELSKSEFEEISGLKSSDYEDATIYLSNLNVKSDEMGIFKYSSEQQSKAIDTAIDKRLETLDKIWGRYLPAQYELVKNAKKFSKGNVKGYVISAEADKIISNIENIK